MTTLDKIKSAGAAGRLMPGAVDNLTAFLGANLPDWAVASIGELVAKEAWSELNDRFYRYLEFGTGGMRGRTIGVVTAAAETGKLSAIGTPEHAAIGSNMLNDFTLIRAVVGLFRYTKKYLGTRAGAARCVPINFSSESICASPIGAVSAAAVSRACARSTALASRARSNGFSR